MSWQQDNAGRTQQSIAAGLLLALGLWLAYVSFRVDDPTPYLFPQLIAVTMVGLGIFAFARALRGANRTGAGFTLAQVVAVAPGIALMLLYVFVLATGLGYYAGAAVAFLALYTLYDSEPHLSPRTWAVRLAITAGFIALIYVVFSVGLQVQTPRGVLL